MVESINSDLFLIYVFGWFRYDDVSHMKRHDSVIKPTLPRLN